MNRPLAIIFFVPYIRHVIANVGNLFFFFSFHLRDQKHFGMLLIDAVHRIVLSTIFILWRSSLAAIDGRMAEGSVSRAFIRIDAHHIVRRNDWLSIRWIDASSPVPLGKMQSWKKKSMHYLKLFRCFVEGVSSYFLMKNWDLTAGSSSFISVQLSVK